MEDARVLFPKHKAKVSASWERVFHAIREEEETLLQLMADHGDDFTQYHDEEGRNVLSYTLVIQNQRIFNLWIDNLAIEEDGFLTEEDIYGKTA